MGRHIVVHFMLWISYGGAVNGIAGFFITTSSRFCGLPCESKCVYESVIHLTLTCNAYRPKAVRLERSTDKVPGLGLAGNTIVPFDDCNEFTEFGAMAEWRLCSMLWAIPCAVRCMSMFAMSSN